MKTKTQRQYRQVRVNDVVNLRVNRKGNVLANYEQGDKYTMVFTAKDLDRIAACVEAGQNTEDRVRKALEGILSKPDDLPTTSRDGQYEISLSRGGCPTVEDIMENYHFDDTILAVGCQYIEPADVRRVHRLSLAMRGLKAKK